METKRILIAETDPAVLEDFRLALGRLWEVTVVDNGTAALEELKKRPYNAIVAGLGLPEPIDGDELLNRARRKQPGTLRLILANEADRERVLKNVMGAHQFLTKPLDRGKLLNQIERALALDAWLDNEGLRQLVGRIRTFPPVPALYLEVLKTLQSPNATTNEVGAIIGKDLAMSTKLLQVINSAYFALPRSISDPTEAVGLLGFETVKPLVLAVKLMSQHEKVKADQLAVDRLWHHSMEVARMAKELVWLELNDRATADAAYAAGLLHDLGKVVLATNFGEQYKGVQSLVRKQGLSLIDVEKEVFGAAHPEIGAYLLGLWGMPVGLVETAAWHHQPSKSNQCEFGVLAAIHLANVFEYEARNEPEEAKPRFDRGFLEQIGMLDRINSRRNAVARLSVSGGENPSPAKPTASPAAPAVSKVPAATPTPVEPVKPAPALPSPARSNVIIKRRAPVPLYASCAVLFLLILAGWALMHYAGKTSVQMNVRATTVEPSSPVATPSLTGTQNLPRDEASPSASTPGPEMEVEEIETAHPAPAQIEEAATNPPSVVSPPLPETPEAPVPVPASQVATQEQLLAPAVDPAAALPALKLQGIVFSRSRPSAIINGLSVSRGDVISGARVIEINADNVLLDYRHQTITLMMQ
jgi:putative nucleotidyltransferase with HDIG domain